MKVRNKKNGMIIDNVKIYSCSGREIHSIAEITDEWEDYNELEHYYILHDGEVARMSELTSSDLRENNIAIGNYFESKEEAEQAVEKLKAWKRLKDKGFKFNCWHNDGTRSLGDFVIHAETKELDNIVNELNLLFGGEDE